MKIIATLKKLFGRQPAAKPAWTPDPNWASKHAADCKQQREEQRLHDQQRQQQRRELHTRRAQEADAMGLKPLSKDHYMRYGVVPPVRTDFGKAKPGDE